jgi:hypothetical protein
MLLLSLMPYKLNKMLPKQKLMLQMTNLLPLQALTRKSKPKLILLPLNPTSTKLSAMLMMTR